MSIESGIFAVLFVSLLFYTMKNSAKREQKYIEREIKYQSLLEKLAETINKEIGELKEIFKNHNHK
jgi:hypothetical protein